MKSIFRKVQAVGFMVGFFASAALVASAHATKAAWPESQCPAFSQRDASGTCQRSVHQEPNYTCPVNMSLHRQNKRCYRSESKPLGFACPSGYKLSDTWKRSRMTCTRYVPPPCLAELSGAYNAHPLLARAWMSMCIAKPGHYIKTEPLRVCPAGFHASGGYCRKNILNSATPVCTTNQKLTTNARGIAVCVEQRKLTPMTELGGYLADKRIIPTTHIQSASISGESNQQLLMLTESNASRVTHMSFDHFNQPDKRMVLVNTPKLNPALVDQAPPQLIVIEHTGSQPMVIRDIEVLGEDADLLFVSQAGVICDSCRFTNTKRVTLATGDIEFNAAGALTNISTNQGQILIRGEYGLTADDALMISLFANRVDLDGPISTQARARRNIDGDIVLDQDGDLIASQGNLQVIAGRITHDYITGDNRVDMVDNSIDLVVKHPITAGSVWLQTTNQYSDIQIDADIDTIADITVLSEYQTHQQESSSQLLMANGDIHLQSFASTQINEAKLSSLSNVNLQGQNVVVRPSESYKRESVEAGSVNIAAEFEFDSHGLIRADEINVAAKFVNNAGGELFAANSLYINGSENINNYDRGILAATELMLVSENAITNGLLEGFKCSEPRGTFNDTSSQNAKRRREDIHIPHNYIKLGGAVGLIQGARERCVQEGKLVSELAPVNRRATIFGFNISIKAPNVINVNPQLKTRHNVWAAQDAPILFQLKDTLDTIISAENNLYIEARNSFRNVSSALEVMMGHFSVRTPLLANERYYIEANTNVDKHRPNRDTHIKETTQYIKSLSPPPYLLVGGNMYIDGGKNTPQANVRPAQIINEAGSVEIQGNLSGRLSGLRSLGLVTQERVDRKVTHHHSERYCSRRIFGKCISRKTRYWTTMSYHLDKYQSNGQLISLFDIQQPDTNIQGLLQTGNISYGSDFH